MLGISFEFSKVRQIQRIAKVDTDSMKRTFQLLSCELFVLEMWFNCCREKAFAKVTNVVLLCVSMLESTQR